MPTSKEVLQIAADEVGYVRGVGKPSKYGEWYGVPGFEKAAYCAMFVSWCFAQAGMPLHPIQHKNGFAYCPYGLRWFADCGMLVKHPKRGDIVFFDWGGDGVPDHVGLVEEVHPTFIKTIEGNTAISNQSNGGKVMRRVRYFPSCCGFVRPNYKDNGFAWSGFYLELTDPYTKRREVGRVQKILIALGFEIVLDFVYGPKTKSAVESYQFQNNLHVDGVVGPNTWEKLEADYNLSKAS